MKTSLQWWNEVKQDDAKFNDWLTKQYHGENLAYERMTMLAAKFDMEPKARRILNTIAEQERTHAEWAGELLKNRGMEPKKLEGHNERYWNVTLHFTDANEMFAVGAHAEKMRLDRIRVIAEDESAPFDVRETFRKILKDETFHEEAFRNLASVDAYEAAKLNHEKGMEALGLTD